MFTILGGDGQEYGPVTADQIRAWIAGGRANLDTKAKLAGTEEWRRVGDLPEFAAPTLPPALTPAAEAGAIPPIPTFTVPLSPGLEPGDRGARLLAVLIDGVLNFVVALPGMALLGMEAVQLLIAASQGREPDFEALNVVRLGLGVGLLALALLALFIVQVVMISTRGQSISKRILGLRIVRHSTGGPAGFVHGWLLRSFLPGFLRMIPYLGFVFGIVDACFIFRDDRRCIHDLMADTRVVKA